MSLSSTGVLHCLIKFINISLALSSVPADTLKERKQLQKININANNLNIQLTRSNGTTFDFSNTNSTYRAINITIIISDLYGS